MSKLFVSARRVLPCFVAALALPFAFAQFTLPLRTHTVQPADIADLKGVGSPALSPDGRFVAYTVQVPRAEGKPPLEHIWLVRTDGSAKARPFVLGSGVDSSPAWSPDGRTLFFLSDRPNPMSTPGSPFMFTVAPGTNRPDIPASLERSEPAAALTPATKPAPLPVPQPTSPQPPPPVVPDTVASAPADPAATLQLWSIAVDGGEAVPLTRMPGGLRSFKLSPDGHLIAFLRADTDSPAERERKARKDDRELVDQEYHFQRLWLFDLAAHQARLLTRDDSNIDTLDWSPDAAALVARVSPTPRHDDFWRVSKVELLDARIGAVQHVLEANSGYQEPRFSLDGTRLVYSRFTTRRITDEHFVRTLATGKEIRLEDLLHGTLAEFRWVTGNRLLINAYVHAHTEASLLDTTSLAVTPLPGLAATSLDFEPTHDAASIAFLSETPTQPVEVSFWKAGHASTLTDTNPQTAGWSLGSQREVEWKSPKDGHTVYGVLSLPPGYVAGTHARAIVHLHGGPEEAFTVGFSGTWYNYAALLASQGYVVLQPNYRGSAGQEIAWTEGDFRGWGGGDFDDVMAGTDWLVQQGFADPTRLAIAGWSYGGYLTSWAVTHTARFKAAMAGAPITDVFAMATTTDIAPSYLTSYLGPLAGNAAEYDRHSATRAAEACHTPVLFLHGAADVRVPTSQSQELYHALRMLGRETELVTYPREPHIFSEREHQIDSLTRELRWFDTHLTPANQAR